MLKKNYLSRGEQEVWDYVKDKDIIDNELISQIFPDLSQNKRNKLLHNLYKKCYLKRAKKDLYFNPEKLSDFHKLALKIHQGYIGLSSALRHYNLIEYEDFNIFIMTKNFQKNISLKGTQYTISFIPLKELFTGYEKIKNFFESKNSSNFIDYEKKDGIYISSIEKTLFDCLLKPRFIGYTNITKALYDAKFDWKRFIDFFKLTKNNSLHQRTGYILELMEKNTKLDIPLFVFDYLQTKVKTPVKLLPINSKSEFNKKWNVQDNVGREKILSWWY